MLVDAKRRWLRVSNWSSVTTGLSHVNLLPEDPCGVLGNRGAQTVVNVEQPRRRSPAAPGRPRHDIARTTRRTQPRAPTSWRIDLLNLPNLRFSATARR